MRYIVKKENAETIYISGGIFVSNGKWTHPKMILDDYELVIVLKGRFQMRIGQARKEFLEGDCFILFPGEEHIGIEAAWDVSFYWLLLFNTIRISLLRLLCGFVPPIILSIMLFDMTSKKFRRISQSILGIYQQLFGLYRSRGQAVPDVGEILPSDSDRQRAVEEPGLVYHHLPGRADQHQHGAVRGGPPGRRGADSENPLYHAPRDCADYRVFGTWLYRQGLGKLKYGLGAAVSVFESSVGLVLVLVSNKLANKFAGLGIW